jgi:hypothetical protein
MKSAASPALHMHSALLLSSGPRHLKSDEKSMPAIAHCTPPQVKFLKPAGRLTQHPSYTDTRPDAFIAC